MRLVVALLGAIGAPLLLFVFAPEFRLRCDEPWLDSRSPDGAWSLTVCRRPMLFAMPGGSSDAPGWIVLRDADDAIRGVVHLSMVQLLYDTVVREPQWEATQVTLILLTTMRLDPASGPVTRWAADRAWRVRALFRLVPRDDTHS